MSIPLYISNRKAYCWDAQDVATLRVRHRICGLMAGTLPGVAQQNFFLGLPLLLMPEEVVLLVDRGICHLIHTSSAHVPPSKAQIEAHTSARQSRLEGIAVEQTLAAVSRKQDMEKKLGSQEEIQRKREERKKAKGKGKAVEGEVQGVAKEGDAGTEDLMEMFVPEAELTTKTEPSTSAPTTTIAPSSTGSPLPTTPSKPNTKADKPIDTSTVFSIIPSTPFGHPWFNPDLTSSSSTFTNLDSARKAGVWVYPETLMERARCGTFRRLWEEGMYQGQGIRFGGEFLVYPGDPLRYHSHFVTTSIPTSQTVLRPLELVAWGRLGTATKKAHLLCCYDEENTKGEGGEGKGEVECWSLEWGNFG